MDNSMNSEKVKEIKKALQDHSIEKLKYQDGIKIKEIDFFDILTLINEFESENERLKEENRILLDKDTLLEMVGLLSKEKDILLNRIAELEKEIKENPSYAKGYADGIKNTYEAMLPQKLENFAERLKEKAISPIDLEDCVIVNDIDETLKEFINEEI